jgi:hypothetical protein
MSFCLIQRFSWIVSLLCSWWDLIDCSHWPPKPCFVTETCFPDFFLLILPYSMSDCAYINTFSPIHFLHMVMNVNWRNFSLSTELDDDTLNCMSLQASILTGAKLELCIAVGLRFHVVERRYHITLWNWFYPVVNSNKYNRGGKNLSVNFYVVSKEYLLKHKSCKLTQNDC